MEFRRHSLVFPAIVIVLGILFLLRNLGVLHADLWTTLWHLWPIWLIAIGLDMVLGRRTAWGSWVMGGAVLLALVGGIWWAEVRAPLVSALPAGAQVTINQPLEDVKRATVEIHTGVNVLQVAAGSDETTLVQGTAVPLAGESIVPEYHRNGDTAYFTLRSAGNVMLPTGDNNLWDLGLNAKLPTSLTVHAGVGRVNLDLTKLTVTDLELNAGVGESQINLPVPHGTLRATVHAGVGAVTIRVPADSAIRVQAHTGLGATNLSLPNLRQDGDIWTSANFAQAQDRIDLEINGGVGAINIEPLH